MKRFDLAAILVIGITLILMIGVVGLGSCIPIDVICQAPDACAEVSPYGAMTFSFTQPVQPDLVEKLWQIEPTVAGKWHWLDDRHAQWHSLEPLPVGEPVTFRFISGPAGQNGGTINAIYWEARVRQPIIVGISREENKQDLFSFHLDAAGIATRLTRTDGRVFDYEPAPDGESLAFSVRNDQNGLDLWIVQRDGTGQSMLLNCGPDRCSTPAWSPVSNELAYTRESQGLTPDSPPGVSRVWILDLTSKQTAPLFSDAQMVGYSPQWSPDGQWLSIWDGAKSGIRVVNRGSSETILLETLSGDTGCWSSNSQSIFYSQIIIGETGFHNVILQANLSKGTIETIFGGSLDREGLSLDYPACHPAERLVVVAAQPNIKIPGRALHLLDPGSEEEIVIMDDLSKLPGLYSWNSDGSRLVFQMDQLTGMENDIEIWTWDRASGEITCIAQGYKFPKWLP